MSGERTNRPPVITLCGSSRFPDAFHLVNAHFSMLGYVVISLGCFGHADQPAGAKFLTADGDEATPQKQGLDQLHYRKIDLSDSIFVINIGGYVGSSTRREIEYAQAQGKGVDYLFSPEPSPLTAPAFDRPRSGTLEEPMTTHTPAEIIDAVKGELLKISPNGERAHSAIVAGADFLKRWIEDRGAVRPVTPGEDVVERACDDAWEAYRNTPAGQGDEYATFAAGYYCGYARAALATRAAPAAVDPALSAPVWPTERRRHAAPSALQEYIGEDHHE